MLTQSSTNYRNLEVSLFEALVQHFGQKIILENGELNRPLLASHIFSNPDEREWSKELKERLSVRDWLHFERPVGSDRSYFFMDIPLLFEQDYASWFNETWLVYVDRDIQVERLMKETTCPKMNLNLV